MYKKLGTRSIVGKAAKGGIMFLKSPFEGRFQKVAVDNQTFFDD